MSLIQELMMIVVRDIRHPNPRLRLAVTPEEYEKIRTEIFDGQSVFSARIADIPIVVDEDTANPRLRVEFKSDHS